MNKNRTVFANEDFLDFSFNGRKASEFGLVRVLTGKRQDDNILPTSKDTTIEVPGGDGIYYTGSKYQQKEFPINFAYDGIYEDDLEAIKEWLAPQKECPLIFAETPYKYYMAKVKSSPKLSYIAFDDADGNRVYRGEGSVQFVCYYPWARSVSRYRVKDLKYLVETGEVTPGTPLMIDNNGVPLMATARADGSCVAGGIIIYPYVYKQATPSYPGGSLAPFEYATAEYLPTAQQLTQSGLIFQEDDPSLKHGPIVQYKNNGQMPTPFKFLFTIKEGAPQYVYIKHPSTGQSLWIDTKKTDWPIKDNEGKNKIYLLDSESHLILSVQNVEYKNNKLTYDIEESNGNAIIKNSAIVAGDFFDLPVGESSIEFDDSFFKSYEADDYTGPYFLFDYLYY